MENKWYKVKKAGKEKIKKRERELNQRDAWKETKKLKRREVTHFNAVYVRVLSHILIDEVLFIMETIYTSNILCQRYRRLLKVI